MSIQVVNERPSNLRTPGLNGMPVIESDVFNICNRIKELDPNLYVVLHKDHDLPFVVMEMCADGQERMVKRYESLDGSIIEDLQRMLHIPWEVRAKELMKQVDEHNERMENAWVESESHEQFIYEMGKALRESGLAPGRTQPVSFYRKRK